MKAESIHQNCTVFFFHLQRQSLEAALPKLLLKTLKQDWRAAICLPDQARLLVLSESLWSVPHEWILPHGFGDVPYPEQQPIWLDTTISRPNNAEVLFLCDGTWQQEADLAPDIHRICLMIEPSNRDATAYARNLWQGIPAEQRKLVKI